MAARKTVLTKAKNPKPIVTEPSVKDPEPVVAEPVVKKKRVYSDDDQIPCMSITPGEYFFQGDKTKTVYSWRDEGVTESMRYEDVTAAIRNRRPCIFKPRIVIQDDELLEGYPELKKLYDSLYSKDDLKKILGLDANMMTQVINKLPDGAKEAVKILAMKAIENGQLDSVARVRALDQIYGTDMLIRLAH